jgi:hypothetical protein
MRTFGTMHPTDQIPVPSDTVNTILLAAGTAQAMDWPANTAICRLTGLTTSGAGNVAFQVNLYTTGVIVPTSGSSIGSSGVTHTVFNQQSFQIQGQSTGFSVVALAPMYVMAECWHK